MAKRMVWIRFDFVVVTIILQIVIFSCIIIDNKMMN